MGQVSLTHGDTLMDAPDPSCEVQRIVMDAPINVVILYHTLVAHGAPLEGTKQSSRRCVLTCSRRKDKTARQHS